MPSKTKVRVPFDTVPLSVELLARLEVIGVDVARVFERAGVALPAQAITALHLSTQQFFALWEAIADVGVSPATGIRIGSEAFNGHLDLASLCALHSRDLSDAFRKLARYKRLTCPEDLRVDVEGSEAAVTFHWLLAEASAPELLVDAIFASTVKLAEIASANRITPKRIELARRTSSRRRLSDHFGCEIRFDAPTDALVFRSSDLAVPFVTYNESLVLKLVPGLDAELASIAGNQTFDKVVDTALLRGMRGQRPSVQTLAADLAMSPRTLQRRLAQSGTYYQERLDLVRQRTAQRLLAKTGLELGQIAWFLGFEELNSFTRIFNRWEGVTPHRWRVLNTDAQQGR